MADIQGVARYVNHLRVDVQHTMVSKQRVGDQTDTIMQIKGRGAREVVWERRS
jgi:hypothetical protein